MNRRRRKQKKVDYLALIKEKCAGVDWRSFRCSLKGKSLNWRAGKTWWLQLPRLHRRLLAVLIPVVFVLIILPVPDIHSTAPTTEKKRIEVDLNIDSLQESTESSSLTTTFPSAQAVKRPSVVHQTQPKEIWKDYTVKQGDTLAQVFRNLKLPMTDLNLLVKVEGEDKPLSQIKVGQKIRLKLDTNGDLDILQLDNAQDAITFFRLSNGLFGRNK